MKKKLELFMGLFMVLAIALATNQMTKQASADTLNSKEYVIVLDAGHGGMDPGKVGINNALEKDINLAIAKKLKPLLEADGAVVIMTRTEDVGLYQETSGNKKREDMKNRCQLVADAKADLVISVHQNSYPEEYVKGAQVFYYKDSEKGKKLAELVQKQFEGTRMAKSNDSYYLLLHTACPIIIVECGFLSNWEEAEKLITTEYQEKMAQAIAAGVKEYRK